MIVYFLDGNDQIFIDEGHIIDNPLFYIVCQWKAEWGLAAANGGGSQYLLAFWQLVIILLSHSGDFVRVT